MLSSYRGAMPALLWVVIAVQLVAGVALAATVDPDETGVETGASNTTTTTTAAPGPGATTTAAPAAGSSTTARGGAATTVTTTTTAPKATAAAVPTLKPVTAGKYAYRLHKAVDGETDTYEGSWSYFTARQTDGELRQLLVDQNEADEGMTRVSLAWRSDGRYTRSFEEEGEDYKDTCNLEPDILEAPSPIVVGKQWTTKTACPEYDPPLNMEGTSKVVRTDRIAIGGKPLAVYVIEVKGRVPVGDMVGEFHTLAWFSVDLGFAVREESTFSVDGEGSDKDVYELVSTTPTPLS